MGAGVALARGRSPGLGTSPDEATVLAGAALHGQPRRRRNVQPSLRY